MKKHEKRLDLLPDVVPRLPSIQEPDSEKPPDGAGSKKQKRKPRRAKHCDADDNASVTSVESVDRDPTKRKTKKHRARKVRRSCPVHGKDVEAKPAELNEKSCNTKQTLTFYNAAERQHSDTKEEKKCTCRRSSTNLSKHAKKSSTVRPEPEGGHFPGTLPLTEYDRILLNNDPIFSDLDNDNPEEDEMIRQQSERLHRRVDRGQGQPAGALRQGRDTENIFAGAQLINTNSSLKFAIIQTELQNIIVLLKRAEGEVQALTRRIRLLEEDFDSTETRLQSASEKLEEASKAADESERGRKVLENRNINDDEKIQQMEKELEETIRMGEEADKNYEEAARKLAVTEVDLERAEARLESAEAKILELEEELKVVGNNMKSLEISEQEASQREDSYEETIRDLTARLKDAENRATEAERTVSKLQKEVDRLEDELLAEKEKYKTISEELDTTFAELAGF